MKKVLVYLLTFILLFTACGINIINAEAAEGLTIDCEAGKIVVSGSFERSDLIGGTYKVYLATSDDDGRLISTQSSDEMTITSGENAFSFEFDILSKEQHVKAYVWANGYIPVCEEVSKTIKSLRVFCVGNSFTLDCMEYLYQIADSSGEYDNIELGIAYIGGSSLAKHWSNASKNTAGAYKYYTNNAGTWSNTPKSFLECLTDNDWDIITVQQRSTTSGVASEYEDYLTNLVNFIDENKTNPDAIFVWNMTWAYQNGYVRDVFETYYNSDQLTMFNAIIDATKEVIIPKEEFAYIIPTGTAVQNIRTTYLGDTLCRDGTHLTYDVGRYLVGLMMFNKLTGKSIDSVSFVPENVTPEIQVIIKESINNAIAKPYEITNSAYPAVDDSPYGYKKIDPEMTTKSYYNSTKSAQKLFTQTNSMNFASSKIFTKDELPVGTIIKVKDGFNVRADGWVALDKKNTSKTRPKETDMRVIVVDDEWWGDFNYRAFNVSAEDNSDLSLRFNESKVAISIYVPDRPIEYKELDLNMLNSSYYNSRSSSDRYTNKSNCAKFISSDIFEKSDLPNGTIIALDNGYTYRPEGWTALGTTNSSSVRPAEVSDSMVIVDDEWWGDFNLRAFNLSKANGSKISGEYSEAIKHLRVYVPTTPIYKEIDLDLQNSSFYNSKTNSLRRTDGTTALYYVSTKMFEKGDLPNDTLITVSNGYRYRPEGWVTLSTKNATRPDNVSTSEVIVDDAWWGDYKYRAFNISYNKSSIDISVKFDEVKESFKIYVPLK